MSCQQSGLHGHRRMESCQSFENKLGAMVLGKAEFPFIRGKLGRLLHTGNNPGTNYRVGFLDK